MKNFIMSILFIVLTSVFNGCSISAVSEPIPYNYTVSTVSYSDSDSNSFYSIRENEDEEKKGKNSFWKLFAIAITVLLVVLFL